MESTIDEQLISDNQMEMMTTMMQMAKLPDFRGPYNNEVVSASFAEPQPNYMENPHQIHNASPPPPFLNVHSTVPFPSAAAVKDQPLHVPVPTNFLSGSAAGTVGNNNNSNNNTNKRNNFAYSSSNINGRINNPQKRNASMAAMREMIFSIAVMQPIHIDPESVKPPKRRNVKISKDPQSVAARHRRERISERIRILQRLVPGGTKMDTASMLDEAIHYVKFLKTQVQSLERAAATRPTTTTTGIGFPVAMSTGSSCLNPINCVDKAYQLGATSETQNIVQHFEDA